MTIEIEITSVSAAQPTSTGVEGALDVRFAARLEGEDLTGEVTLLPHEDGRLGYGRWGAVDNWLDGRSVARLRDLDEGVYSDTLDAIEAACARRCR